MSMMGIKGMDYLNEVWDLAKSIGCKCKADDNFAQDVLGSVRCEHCNKEILTQYQVDVLEARELIESKPKVIKGRFTK